MAVLFLLGTGDSWTVFKDEERFEPRSLLPVVGIGGGGGMGAVGAAGGAGVGGGGD